MLAGAAGSATAAILHVASIPFGADGLRYFGAGRRMVELAEQGSVVPALATGGIAAALAVAALYGRGQIGRGPSLPWQQRVFVAITAIYLLRGVALVPQLVLSATGADVGPARELVFSAVALGLGLLHLPGVRYPAARREGAIR